MKSTIGQFKGTASLPQQGIAVIFDLEGFSKFFSQPDVQEYVPKFLNIVLDAIEICFNGGTEYWKEKASNYSPLPAAVHSKFLGDGALYIFRYSDFSERQRKTLCYRLWSLGSGFEKIVERAADQIPVLDIPKRIRVGIAAGTVYRLTYSHSRREEYIGYCINLASRLQSYCREVSLIISGRLNLPAGDLKKSNYTRLVAKKIKGFPEEIVYVANVDYKRLDTSIRADLFTSI